MEQGHHDDAISLKQLFTTIGDYLREIRGRVLVILLLAILIFGFFLIRYLTTPAFYKAECTFMLNESEQSGTGVSSLLGQIGIGNNTEFNLEKIVELARSRTMSSQVLLDTAVVGDNVDLLANHFIKELSAHNYWTKTPWYKGKGEMEEFRFVKADDSKYSRQENSALKLTHQRFIEYLETDIDDITGILTFSFESSNEELAHKSANRLFDSVSDYYQSKSVAQQQQTYNVFAYKCDSLENALNSKEYSLANFRDTYRSQWLETENVREDRLIREVKMLALMYGEALKSRELAAYALANSTPFVQVIDRPIMPLAHSKENLWRDLLTSILLALLIGGAYIVGIKAYRDIMDSE